MNTEIATMLIVLAVTVVLLALEVVRIDIVAMVCMLALGWLGILDAGEMFLGFSSSAVIVVMAVMVMGRGIDKSGIMDRFSRLVAHRVGNNKGKIIVWMSLIIGIMSGFIQNIGAVALFLPSILNISRRSKIPSSELIMPLGFAAILGGTLTMVGSGPLILVNDLLRNAQIEPFGTFAVTPLGILLLLTGIGYFFIFGKIVLPRKGEGKLFISDQERLIQRLHLPDHIWHYSIGDGSPLIGRTLEDSGIWQKPSINILGMIRRSEIEYAPWRGTVFEAGQEIALIGNEEDIKVFAEKNSLIELVDLTGFDELGDPSRSGFAEVVVPGCSELVGRTIREYSIRKRYAVEPLMLFSKGREIRGDISDHVIQSGDTIIVYGLWERISDLKASIDFVVASLMDTEKQSRLRSWCALICFTAAIGLAIGGFPVSLAFFTGAVAFVISRTLTVREMYEAIEWKVVFLLAGLIPLGVAMQKTGTATFLAENLISMVLGKDPILIVMIVGVLATAFSLFMSNVGAIVVLAPVVIEMARIGGYNPRPLVLMAAVCAANSFIIPTHQVNAFIMSPGGYRNADYFRAGIGMTLIFLVISVLYFSIIMM